MPPDPRVMHTVCLAVARTVSWAGGTQPCPAQPQPCPAQPPQRPRRCHPSTRMTEAEWSVRRAQVDARRRGCGGDELAAPCLRALTSGRRLMRGSAAREVKAVCVVWLWRTEAGSGRRRRGSQGTDSKAARARSVRKSSAPWQSIGGGGGGASELLVADRIKMP
mmetsp:Transcript_28936/g.69251  ORF Transcript_28936/g.69251 Transcript_28936/m.69251 type:complete len:164 (+) Transcript_28936:311-802(+)